MNCCGRWPNQDKMTVPYGLSITIYNDHHVTNFMSKDTLFRSFWLGATFNLSTSKGSQQLPYHVKRLREFGAIAINQASISHQPPPATARLAHTTSTTPSPSTALLPLESNLANSRPTTGHRTTGPSHHILHKHCECNASSTQFSSQHLQTTARHPRRPSDMCYYSFPPPWSNLGRFTRLRRCRYKTSTV
jgi:hypothetical protein